MPQNARQISLLILFNDIQLKNLQRASAGAQGEVPGERFPVPARFLSHPDMVVSTLVRLSVLDIA